MNKNEKRDIPDISFKNEKSLKVPESIMQESIAEENNPKEIAQPEIENADVKADETDISENSADIPETDSISEDTEPSTKPTESESEDSPKKEKETPPKLEFSDDYSVPKKKKTNTKKKKKKKKKKSKFNFSIIGGLTITIAIIAMSIVLAFSAITLGMEYLGLNKSDNEVTFNIPEGSTNDEIADILVKNDIINSTYGKDLFKLALKINKPDALYPGDITLSPAKSYPDIISELSEMRKSYETVTITIPEGATLLEVSELLEKNNVCSADEFLFEFNATQDFDLDKTLTHDTDVYYTMEGYFYPDTYDFYVEDSAYNVTKIVREHFSEMITDDMLKRMDELDMSLNEVVTLASIVQWEAGSVDDMPTVASVFLNRLNDPDTFPTLQSDATKSYIKKVIDKVETSTTMVQHYTNVYDTYTCIGLPAGPICNPGIDAINAVLYPEDTNYYYFCNNLETGKSFFAETYKQHQKNLKKAGLEE